METAMLIFAVCAVLSPLVVAEENRLPNPLMDFQFKEPSSETKHWNMPEDHAIRRFLAASPGKFLGKVTDDDVENLRQRLKQEDWNQFTPPPITEVQCHVEFQVVKRVPGRCTKLGGHIPACQTEEYVEIDYNECS